LLLADMRNIAINVSFYKSFCQSVCLRA